VQAQHSPAAAPKPPRICFCSTSRRYRWASKWRAESPTKIILRNSTIPASATPVLHHASRRTSQRPPFHVLQGEREPGKGLPLPGPFRSERRSPHGCGNGAHRGQIPYRRQRQSCTSLPVNSAAARKLRYKSSPATASPDEQVEGMILDSFDSAEEDFRRRQVIEARNEAATILAALDQRQEDVGVGSPHYRREKRSLRWSRLWLR